MYYYYVLLEFEIKFSAYAKVIALIVLIFTGLFYLFFTDKGRVENFTTQAWTNTKFGPGDIVIALYQGLFSYSGWDTLNFLVEELQNPYENMPKEMVLIFKKRF